MENMYLLISLVTPFAVIAIYFLRVILSRNKANNSNFEENEKNYDR